MEIIVEGKGTNWITPNQVIMNLKFEERGIKYEEVLTKGSENVEIFIQEILEKNGFNKDEMKTRNFVVSESKKYDEQERAYVFDGYIYNQDATLKFDYDKHKMANMMEQISKLETPPICQINFSVKAEKKHRMDILKTAYQDAESQAYAIATSAGKILRQCKKVDFKPFNTEYISTTQLRTNMMYEENAYIGNSTQSIMNTFTPEDIEITETLYCLWLAE